ncbi:MAG: alpha/beta fold hydrolase, partial [bacterium]|nr:alpha/beta fold hydrolase [bacterium]
MNPLIRIAIIIVVCYLALVLFVFFRQKNMVYYPTGTIVATPAAIQLKYKEIVFTTSDRVQLYGWFVGDESKKEVILFCHGNGGNISHRLDTLSIFNQLGLRTFIFDYRGYGKSAGETTEEGTYLDVQAAWDYLTKHQKIPPQRIILYGRSLGGAVIANLAAKVKPRQLIIESSFTSVP